MRSIIIIAHNIRSLHNVGSLFRTCEGFGVEKLILSGYTPYPSVKNDTRLPHVASKMTAQIQKTALGAEKLVNFEHHEHPPLEELRNRGYRIVALEQAADSILLPAYEPPGKIALLLGEEVEGVDHALLEGCDESIEIPMRGKKESFNVSVAAGIAIYGLTAAS